jgi:hypothetical protein
MRTSTIWSKQRQKLNTEVLRFTQNDDIKQATAKTTTKADPYGMTNKGANINNKSNRRSFDSATRKVRESLAQDDTLER